MFLEKTMGVPHLFVCLAEGNHHRDASDQHPGPKCDCEDEAPQHLRGWLHLPQHHLLEPNCHGKPTTGSTSHSSYDFPVNF